MRTGPTGSLLTTEPLAPNTTHTVPGTEAHGEHLRTENEPVDVITGTESEAGSELCSSIS